MLGDKQEDKFGGVMSAQKHSLQTRDLARFGISFIYIWPRLITFLIFGFYLVFVGETWENVEKGALQEAWRRVVQKVAQRRDVLTSRRCGKVSTNLISWRRYKRNVRITLWGFEINLQN